MAVAVGEHHVAVVILDCANPTSPLPVQVHIRPGKRVTASELTATLDAWKPPAGPVPPITSDTLRTLGLRDVTAAWAAAHTPPLVEPDHEPLDARLDAFLDFDWPTGGVLGYRRKMDLRAALARALAAHSYQWATRQGSQTPTLDVERALALDSATQARDLIARARRDGFLTEGAHGRPGGVMTDKAATLLAALIDYKKGPQP